MIQCKHKWQMQILNRGLNTWFCSLLGKAVNEDICSTCKYREGEMVKDVVEMMDFPKRNPQEIKVIYNICKGCPLHDEVKKTCKKTRQELYPTDIVAQHPNNHCPEDKW